MQIEGWRYCPGPAVEMLNPQIENTAIAEARKTVPVAVKRVFQPAVPKVSQTTKFNFNALQGAVLWLGKFFLAGPLQIIRDFAYPHLHQTHSIDTYQVPPESN